MRYVVPEAEQKLTIYVDVPLEELPLNSKPVRPDSSSPVFSYPRELGLILPPETAPHLLYPNSEAIYLIIPTPFHG